jgi:hypothetical protein
MMQALDCHGDREVEIANARGDFLSKRTPRSSECDPDRASAYPNGAAVPDYTISFGHQLKPIWNIGRIGNFDRNSIDGDVFAPGNSCSIHRPI